ncbi:hypothetical protein RRG08_065539, partial [Elysia crispata]
WLSPLDRSSVGDLAGVNVINPSARVRAWFEPSHVPVDQTISRVWEKIVNGYI